jgi:hypothetical protein
VPAGTPAGRHTVQVVGADTDNSLVSVSLPVEINGAGAVPIGRLVLIVLMIALVVAVFIPARLRKKQA